MKLSVDLKSLMIICQNTINNYWRVTNYCNINLICDYFIVKHICCNFFEPLILTAFPLKVIAQKNIFNSEKGSL